MAYNPDTHRNVGRELKAALAAAGLFQHEAAKILNLPKTTFNMKLLGRRQFTEDEKAELSKVLNTPVEALFPATEDTECVLDTQAKSEACGP